MKIDKKVIDKVLTLNDDQLWKTILLVASKSGLDSTKDLKRPDDMSKLRSTLSSLTEEDVARVSEIIKKGKNNG